VMEAVSDSAFDGVMTYDETLVPLAAAVAAEAGLPGLSQTSAASARDKHRMRSAWSAANVPSARFGLAGDVRDAARIADEIRYPVVLKPRNLGGSIGVVAVHNSTELHSHFPHVASARHDGFVVEPSVLVEEMLDGPEVSVEGIVHEGELHIGGITDKRTGMDPYFEELGHVAAPWRDHASVEEITAVAARAHAALGISVGATHTEMRLGPSGPKLIEIAARLGGDLIPLVHRYGTGVRLSAAAGRVACGDAPDLGFPRQRTAAIRMFYPTRAGRVVRRELHDNPGRSRSHWEDFQWRVKVGDLVGLPPDQHMGRLAHLIVSADNRADCELSVAEADAWLDVEIADA
jgi:biotin carboxylase